jgi:hypothetical protein
LSRGRFGAGCGRRWQQQIPKGNDRKKSKGNYKCKGKGNYKCKSKGNYKSKGKGNGKGRFLWGMTGKKSKNESGS